MFYYEVFVPSPLDHALTYSSEQDLITGQTVTVPLRNKPTTGVIFKKTSEPQDYKALKIIETQTFKIPPDYMKWVLWLADYYFYPPGLVIDSLINKLDRGKTKKKSEPEFILKKLNLTNLQKEAFTQLNHLDSFYPQFLHGVTGSGKTEIYMELFDEVLKKNKQGLFLLPEISLTPQLERRFKERFGSPVSVFHSQMTPRQRANSWLDFYENKTKILIGARSALFCPSENLGLIIVDEEHESSFKQEEKFLYHARDAALKLAQIKNIPIVMGSATPSLESFYNIKNKKFNYVKLDKKVFEQSPVVPEIIDMANQKPSPFWLSFELKNKIDLHLAQKKQVALFLNRRGWANLIQCRDCGYTFKCLNCDVSLTLHKKTELFCHYCGYGDKVPNACPDCHQESLYKMGLGTEQVVNDLEKIYPNHRILKFDRDEIGTKNQLIEAISKIENHEVDIIIGTQMIAKGLDFSNLSLMGVLDADQSLNFPDFRATEKSLQQMLQVLGRVGRRKNQNAEVVIQTRTPENKIFTHLQESKFDSFCTEQLETRQRFNYPPHAKMVVFFIRSKTSPAGDQLSQKIANYCHHLKEAWTKHYSNVVVLGPCTAPIQKIRNEFRYQVILKFPENTPHQPFIKEIKSALGKLPPKTRLQINVDPIDLM